MTSPVRFLLLICLLLSMMGCPLPGDDEPGEPTTAECGYEATPLNFSDPRGCDPDLLTFGSLDQGYTPPSGAEAPTLPDDCTTQTGNFRIAEVSGVTGGSFVLHVYRATVGTTLLSVFGETDCNEFETIVDCADVSRVASRVAVTGVRSDFRRVFVRFSVDTEVEYLAGENIQLAAYDDIDYGLQRPFIEYNYLNPEDKRYPQQFDGQLNRLPVNCDGTAFQRLILSTCGEDSTVLKKWAELAGVPVSEQYYSEKGHVVALTVPPGMDLNTTGGAMTRVRSRVNNGNGSVEPDYIINLFDPSDPSNFGGDLPVVEKDPEILQADGSLNYFFTLFKDIQPRQKFDMSQKALRISIIDSGVDFGYSNDPGEAPWLMSDQYKHPASEFVFSQNYGFDFIEKDYTPNDRLPHGNAVTWSILNNYQADRPLDLVHLKVFGRQGAASYFGALVSLYEANRIGSDIINMSWGFYGPKAPEALTCALDRAVTDGIYLIASAGNDARDINASPQWPAALSQRYAGNMLTVGSYWYGLKAFEPKSDPDAVKRKDYSNYNRDLVQVAGYMTNPIPTEVGKDPYFPIGTSISAPLISAELGNYISNGVSDPLGALSGKFGTATGLQGFIFKEQYLPLPPRSFQP
jgi:hypothetical protein